MRSVDQRILDKIESGEISLFQLLKMTIDGVDYCYTDCDVPLVYASDTYEPRGFKVSDITFSKAKIVDEAKILIENLDSELSPVFVGGTPQGSDIALYAVLIDEFYHIIGDSESEYLQAWYAMNEGYGTDVFDLSGNSNHAVLGALAPAWDADGITGKCLLFENTAHNSVVLPNSIVNVTEECAISIWVNPTDVSTLNNPIIIQLLGSYGVQLVWEATTKFSAKVDNGGVRISEKATPASFSSDASYYHVVVNIGQGGTIDNIFVNGVDQTLTSQSILSETVTTSSIGSC